MYSSSTTNSSDENHQLMGHVIYIDRYDNVITNIKKSFFESIQKNRRFEIMAVNMAHEAETEWFDDEIIGTKHGDFFVKRSINYSKRAQSITSDDLF